jgi:CheY-like chemotaxis protein
LLQSVRGESENYLTHDEPGSTICAPRLQPWGAGTRAPPRRAGRGRHRAQPITASADTARGAETILLVEDEREVRALARDILKARGYTVLEASDGTDALQISERHPGTIHLVLTDLVMPGMSGRELVSRLTILRPGVAVLYMSGYTDDAMAHHDVLDPPVAFLLKPMAPDALARKVREILDQGE